MTYFIIIEYLNCLNIVVLAQGKISLANLYDSHPV